jgi:Do/DeqQ family serine protease
MAWLTLITAALGCKDEPPPPTAVDAAVKVEHAQPPAPASEPPPRVQAPAPASAPPPRFSDAVKAIRPAVVSIVPDTLEGAHEAQPLENTALDSFLHGPHPAEQHAGSAAGSGTIIDAQGHILTNNHVSEGAAHVRVVLADERELDGKIIATDPQSDLAVIGVEPGDSPLQPATLGDSDALDIGDWVLACGNPFGFKQIFSAGIVSALGRRNVGISEYEDFIQTDAVINPGSSGGPLVDGAGRVIGISTAIASKNESSAGFGFAIPIEMAMQIVGQLLDHGKVIRGYIGLYMGDVTHDLAQTFGYKNTGGALVEDITPSSPGARAGVLAGDIIAEQDGQRILSAAHFRNAIAALSPGNTASFKIWRDGKWITLRVKIGDVPGDAHAGAHGTSPAPEPRWGMLLADIPLAAEQHAEGLPDHGALVQGVRPDSAAHHAELRSGDVVVDIDGKRVSGAADAQRLLETAKGLVRLRVVRDGHALFLAMASSSD